MKPVKFAVGPAGLRDSGVYRAGEVGPYERHAGHPALGLHREHLVQLDSPLDEPHTGPGQVQLPHPGPGFADLGDRLVPVRLEIGTPRRARAGVVLPEVFLVAHLEAVVLDGGDDRTYRLELTIGEDVAIDETSGPGRNGRHRPGDAVIEEATLGPQPGGQEPDVAGQVLGPDVLGEADTADRVEPPSTTWR